MRKIVISILVFVLVFSELNVFLAETIVGEPTELEIECEKQLESGDIENIAAECKELETENGEAPTTEGKEQPESENGGNPTTEGKEQPESESGGNPTTEGKEQPESENGGNPTTEGKEQPESENGEAPTTEGKEQQPESENGEEPTKEGEEQPETETEENLPNACERQPESESEENLATEGEEQLESDDEENLAIDCEEEPNSEENLEIDCEEEFYIEEELVTEEEGQLEPNKEVETVTEQEEQLELNKEEEPVTEEEEQLGSDKEEELVTTGEEQEELDSEEKPAPKCKRVASPRVRKYGIPLADVGAIGKIDFSKLDEGDGDPINLGFTQIEKNVGLKLPTRDKEGREYYMYFGDINNGRSVDSLKNLSSYEGSPNFDDWGRPLPTQDKKLQDLVEGRGSYVVANNFSVVTALAQEDSTKEDGVVTYYYLAGRANRGNQTGNGLVIAQANGENAEAAFQSSDLPILQLYKNEQTHELIAYAAVIRNQLDETNNVKKYVDGYVKIKMGLINGRKGRIHVSMKYLKLSTQYSHTNIGYSVHMDIAKRHEASKMFSLGNHKGLYFNEKNVGDNQEYYLYFYRDGYANHPQAMAANNSPIYKPFDNGVPKYRFFTQLNTPGIEDPGRDVLYPYTEHPGWALRWEPKVQEAGTVREDNLEIAVTNRPDMAPVIQLDNDGEYVDNGYHITGTWNNSEEDSKYVDLYYTVNGSEPTKFERIENPDVHTDVPWSYTIRKEDMEIKEGLDYDINVYAVSVIVEENENVEIQSNIETIKIRPNLTVTERVFDKDNKEVEEAARKEILNYHISIESEYIPEDKGQYDELTITQTYDTHLGAPTDLKVMNDKNEVVGTATYNSSTNTIEASLNKNLNLSRSTNIYVTYNAQVKEEAVNGETIVSQTTVSGQYSTGDTFKKTSEETKILINSRRKKVSEVGKIGDIDFSKLDAPNELDGFEQMTHNRLLEFPVDESIGRRYFMHFGDYNTERNKDNLEGISDYYKDDSMIPLPSDDTTLEALLQTKYIVAQNFAVMTLLPHSKPYGAITYYSRKGISNTPLRHNGLVIAQGNNVNAMPDFQSTKMPILKLYKNEATHELMAYAAIINGNYLDGYVKIKMRPLSTKGRVSVSMKYLKLNDEYQYTNFGYRVEMDIAGLSTDKGVQSWLNSLGNDRGFYFAMRAPYINERHTEYPYYLYFYRDGYANHPAALKAITKPNLPFSERLFSKMNAKGTPDPGKGHTYDPNQGLGWALRWEPEEQKFGDVREANLEIMATSKERQHEIRLDNNGEYTNSGYYISGTWMDDEGQKVSLYYTLDGSEPKKIREDENTKPGAPVKWEYTIPNVKKGSDHDITVYIKNELGMKSNEETIKLRPALTATEQVFDESGIEVEEAAPEETLSYSILINSGYISNDKGKYNQLNITQTYDTHLDDPTDLKVVNDKDEIVGTATYNSSTNKIEASLDPSLEADLSRSRKIYVTYNATVKETAESGETIVAQATVSGKYSTGDTFKVTSNEVRTAITAVLKFNSVPQVIDFGEKLVISSRTKKYHPVKVDTPLAVKDTRTQSSETPHSWTVTAKLKTPLKGSKTGAKLESLRYHYGTNDSFITEDSSAEIYTREPTDGRRTVDISNTWSEEGDGLYLEVLAGTARADAFEGAITWTLHDVPPNDPSNE